jgi:hypothetical protein|tara:strand:+ start:150 stop:953 length:804 start_codon:yes stop_codon:yes gene_type:complete
MANVTSDTYTFDQTFSIDEIIADAFERLGLVNSAGHQLKTARRSLNILFQEWGNRGVHFWEIGNANINLIVGSSTNADATAEGSGTYTFYRSPGDVPGGGEPPQATTVPTANVYGITDILNATYRSGYNTTNQSDTGLTKITRDTYSAVGNKFAVGTPSQFWVQRFIDRVTITFYPLPNSGAASNFVNVYYVKRIQDAGDYTNASDTPYRFVPCMVSGLAFYLSMKFAPQRTQEMKLLYEDELARALSEDGSAASTFITPKTYYPNI